MIRKQLILDLHREMIVDNFAGGGGASTGIELTLGRCSDIAINHDRKALAMHEANHPQTLHLAEDVFAVDPVTVTQGRPVGLAWFSPDCKHFSKAKGGKPRSKKVRGLAWVMVKWAATVRPRVMVLENVEEFKTWGPLLGDGSPCPRRSWRRMCRSWRPGSRENPEWPEPDERFPKIFGDGAGARLCCLGMKASFRTSMGDRLSRFQICVGVDLASCAHYLKMARRRVRKYGKDYVPEVAEYMAELRLLRSMLEYVAEEDRRAILEHARSCVRQRREAAEAAGL